MNSSTLSMTLTTPSLTQSFARTRRMPGVHQERKRDVWYWTTWESWKGGWSLGSLTWWTGLSYICIKDMAHKSHLRQKWHILRFDGGLDYIYIHTHMGRSLDLWSLSNIRASTLLPIFPVSFYLLWAFVLSLRRNCKSCFATSFHKRNRYGCFRMEEAGVLDVREIKGYTLFSTQFEKTYVCIYEIDITSTTLYIFIISFICCELPYWVQEIFVSPTLLRLFTNVADMYFLGYRKQAIWIYVKWRDIRSFCHSNSGNLCLDSWK